MDRHEQEYRMYRQRQMFTFVFIGYPIGFTLIFLFFFAWPPVKKLVEAKHEIMIAQAQGLSILPELESKLGALENRTAALTTENIDARLQTIEKAIEVGEIKPEELSSLQQLREDFTTLKTFMFADPERLVEFRSIQQDYSDLKKISEKLMDKTDIQREIDSVRHLFYATLAICGILVSILAGAWFVALRRNVGIPPPKAPNKSAEGDEE